MDAAFANIELAQRERAARTDLKRTEREMEELNRIGMALSETHDVGELLEMILSKARQITGADAGSLYLVEEAPPDVLAGGPGVRHLRFKRTQNDSMQVSVRRIHAAPARKFPRRLRGARTEKSSTWPTRIAFPPAARTASTAATTMKPAIARDRC